MVAQEREGSSPLDGPAARRAQLAAQHTQPIRPEEAIEQRTHKREIVQYILTPDVFSTVTFLLLTRRVMPKLPGVLGSALVDWSPPLCLA